MSCATSVTPKFLNGAWQQYLKPLSSPENDVQIWIANVDSNSPEEIDQLLASLTLQSVSARRSFASSKIDVATLSLTACFALFLRRLLAVLQKRSSSKNLRWQNRNSSKGARSATPEVQSFSRRRLGVDRSLLESRAGNGFGIVESLPDDEQSLSQLAARVLSNASSKLGTQFQIR